MTRSCGIRLVLSILLVVGSMLWMWTHDGCAYPIENLAAFALLLAGVAWAGITVDHAARTGGR